MFTVVAPPPAGMFTLVFVPTSAPSLQRKSCRPLNTWTLTRPDALLGPNGYVDAPFTTEPVAPDTGVPSVWRRQVNRTATAVVVIVVGAVTAFDASVAVAPVHRNFASYVAANSSWVSTPFAGGAPRKNHG